MPGNQAFVEIFCSYAHEDEVWEQRLKTHLSVLQLQGQISFWYDRLIVPGTDWAKEIDTHLQSASLILFLISADFFASDYCYGIEMQQALKRHEEGAARVIPVLIRPVDNWQSEPFAHLQVLPTDARFLTQWADKDEGLADISAGIRRSLDDLAGQPANSLHIPLPSLWNVPYRRNPFFLGRDELLSPLHRRFQDGPLAAVSQVQAMSGLGGVGKTQIAVEYAYRYRQDYRTVFWVRAQTTETLTASYVEIAAMLGLSRKDEQEQQLIINAVKQWLEIQDRWLLILDNADDIALLSEFLPTSPGGHLLLTTRAPALGALDIG